MAARHELRAKEDRRVASGESVVNLLVKIAAVGNDDDAGIRDFFNQVFDQHYHCQRFARSLRMPDQSAAPFAVFVFHFNAGKRFLYGKVLLITGDFFDAVVVKDKVAHQIKQPFRFQQAVNAFVLFG